MKKRRRRRRRNWSKRWKRMGRRWRW